MTDSIGSVSHESNALIFFADIIDSSKHCTVLGILKYAKKIREFQALFQNLANKYFSEEETSTSYSAVRSRGDEGTIFCVNSTNWHPGDLVYRSVKFAYELKGRMRLLSAEKSPRPMDIGVGIHFGPVAVISRLRKTDEGRPLSVISGIEGFSINYAKRVESSSRIGKYSKIFLSKEAAHLLDGDPVVLTKQAVSMKGFNDAEDVFEVRSVFFDNFPEDTEGVDYQRFISQFSTQHDPIELARNPWIKAVILSVVESLAESAADDQLRAKYAKVLSNLVWSDVNENDPMVLFCRARNCGREGKETARLMYLKKITDAYPDFLHARKQLADACWKIASSSNISAQLIYARDVADEFVSRFPQYLSEQEKENFDRIRNLPDDCSILHPSAEESKDISPQ